MEKQTKLVRTQTPKTQYREHSTPLFLTSSFCFEDAEQGMELFNETIEGNIYSRFSNPSVQEFVDKVCILEDCEDGIATGTGMAAVFAGFAAHLQAGDHLVSSRALFGSAHQIITQILAKWGVTHTYLDATATEQEWEAAVLPTTKMIYVETPTNPGLDIIDLEMLGALAKKHNLILNVDNCFATPIGQTPIDLGADLVVHSATKWIDGQGRVLGGAVVGRKELIHEIYLFCRSTGPSLSPFNAWVLSKILETLEVRMERHSKSAFSIAQKLEGHAKINFVKYPFLASHPQHAIAVKQMKHGGGLVCFELKGGLEAGRQFLNHLKMLSLTANLGDSRSIASHPASTTHAKLSEAERQAVGITPGLIRISVGLEHEEDILHDILQALEA